MPWLQLGLTGGHTVAVELEDDEAEPTMALITRSMDAGDQLPGHLELRPTERTTMRIRLGDIVLAELSEEKPD